MLSITDDVRFKVVRVINVLASKNTMETRSLMKASGLFELRDSFLLELLNSEVHTSDSMQLLQQINMEALASGTRFRDSRTIETLLARIVETKDAALRKGISSIFQRQICKCPENAKYLSKVIEDATLVEMLSSKSLEELDAYLGESRPETKKALERLLRVSNTQKTERMKQQLRNAQDRSSRRNRTFSDVAKEKANTQSAIADYEVLSCENMQNRARKRSTWRPRGPRWRQNGSKICRPSAPRSLCCSLVVFTLFLSPSFNGSPARHCRNVI